ncbi:MAG: hypothetical protein M9936_25925 [Caldilinea sp.]|nr:hypothetical protein [Caldilinea sp.]MCB9117107.1 hypothetical protein [Caldilineaceae bacterium]MCB9118830.1 hypothetical protein [Caldilineaceae bacterium]MCB9124983.1 hypothetical protein [Caldilineaceae bacterium]MCO5213153.1 hypothetical protein [Caldilinea sp.]
MANQPDAGELARCHRWFAVEGNNRAWALVAQDERTPDEELLMLTLAHVAAFHWSAAGGPLEVARADYTLAHAYALAGQGRLALRYARRALTFFEENPAEGEDWDRAFAHAELAHAAAAARDAELHAAEFAQAALLGAAIADAEDRTIFLAEFARLPKPLT